MSFERKLRFIDTQAESDAKGAVQMAGAIIRESYYRNNPPKVHPFRDALLILSAVALGFVILSSKPVNPFEINRAQFNSPKPIASNMLKDSNR